eukprot:3615279-Rhodomonas_salina.1
MVCSTSEDRAESSVLVENDSEVDGEAVLDDVAVSAAVGSSVELITTEEVDEVGDSGVALTSEVVCDRGASGRERLKGGAE